MPTLVLADVVQSADVRVIEGRDRLGLAPKALESRRRVRERGWEELEGHLSAEAQVLGAIHDTHAALPDLLEDLVVRDDLFLHRRGRIMRRYSERVTFLRQGDRPAGGRARGITKLTMPYLRPPPVFVDAKRFARIEAVSSTRRRQAERQSLGRDVGRQRFLKREVELSPIQVFSTGAPVSDTRL